MKLQHLSRCTLQGTNISYLGKRNIILKSALVGGYVSFQEGISYWKLLWFSIVVTVISLLQGNSTKMNFSWILYHQLTNQKLHVHPTPLRTNGYPAKKLYNWKRKKPYFKASIFNDQPLDFQQRNWDVSRGCFFAKLGAQKIFPSSYHPRKKTMSTPGFQGGQPWSPQVNHGAVWTCSPPKPCAAPRMCDVCSFGPGNLRWDGSRMGAETPGGWCGVKGGKCNQSPWSGWLVYKFHNSLGDMGPNL